MVGDPVGDFITQLKNASMSGKGEISLPYSKLKYAVAEKLKTQGLLKSAEKRGRKIRKYLDIELNYFKNGSPRISSVTRISKPGRRVYKKVSEIHPVRHGKGTLILSTPKGILTGDEARKGKIGGEALFEIW